MRFKDVNKLLSIGLIFIISLLVNYLTVYASNEGIISNGTVNITVDIVDPINYWSSGIEYIDSSNQVTIYTAKWHNTTTKRTNVVEYQVMISDNIHTITKKNENGDTFIPLNGYVLSIPNNNLDALSFNVGDNLTISNITGVNAYQFAVETQDGIRSIITNKNIDRTTGMLVYYDNTRGTKTNTNIMGAEMVVKFDYDAQTFRVESFRRPGVGDSTGIEIPSDGFVLSGAGVPYQFYLIEGNKFNIGDKIELINFDFLGVQETRVSFNDINPTLESNPDGSGASSYRGTNQLIVYTSDWAGKTTSGFTGTNQYGYEAAVSNTGGVIEIGTNVLIPENGFVVSGNGTAAALIRNNIKIGSEIEFNENSKTLIIKNSSVNTQIYTVEALLKDAIDMITYVEDGLYDVELIQAKEYYQQAQTHYNEMISLKTDLENSSDMNERIGNTLTIIQKGNEAQNLLEKISYLTMPSQVVEARALWHRPSEVNLDQIKAHLDEFQSLGFNLIYIETLWNGYSNYPSDYVEVHPNISGNSYGEYGEDYLKAFISEAHARGIEVQAWNEIFFVGHDSLPLSNILSEHPEWRMINYDGTKSQNGIIFMDPTNPEVYQLLENYFTELFTKYDMDGFQYDYIRYPLLQNDNNPDTIEDSGYTEYAMNAFKTEYNLTGDLRQLVKNDANIMSQWDEWRRNQITTVVEKLSRKLKSINPDIEISMAVAPDYINAKINYLQDWTVWIKNGYIDTITPMVYHYDTDFVSGRALNIQGFTKNLTYQYTGIGPVYYGYPVINNQQQTVAVNKVGAFGTAIFASHNILGNEAFQNALLLSTNRKEAILPSATASEVTKVILDDILDKADRIYIHSDVMSVAQKSELEIQFDTILSLKMNNAEEIYIVKEKIDILKDYAFLYVQDAAKDRLTEDLDRLSRILDIKVSHDLINRGFWDPKVEETRPDVTQFDYPEEPSTPPVVEPPVVKQPTTPADQTENNINYIYYTIGGVAILSIGVGYILLIKRKS